MVGCKLLLLSLSGSGRATQETTILGFQQQVLPGIHNKAHVCSHFKRLIQRWSSLWVAFFQTLLHTLFSYFHLWVYGQLSKPKSHWRIHILFFQEIFTNPSSDRGLRCNIYKEHTMFDSRETNSTIHQLGNKKSKQSSQLRQLKSQEKHLKKWRPSFVTREI